MSVVGDWSTQEGMKQHSGDKNHRNKSKNNATFMNEWVQRNLRAPVSKMCHPGCIMLGLIPQYNFIWDEHGNKQVDRLIRFETMHQDFEKLKAIYDLPANLTIPNKRVNSRRKGSTLNRNHFAADTLELIHHRYEKDFDLVGGYERLNVSSVSR